MNATELTDYIEKLTKLGGVSSSEGEIANFLFSELSKLCDEAYKDSFGNVYGKVFSPEGDAENLLIEAHMDRVGIVVTDVTDEGYVEFAEAGGLDPRTLPYSKIELLCEDGRINGVIQLKESAKDKTEKLTTCDMKIFTGIPGDKLKKRVPIGTKGIIDPSFLKLCEGRIASSALDNRIGIASVIKMLKEIDTKKLKYNLTVLFTAGEELGLHGAYTADLSNIDLAVAVDVTHGETCDSKNEAEVFPLGSGAVICRGPNLDYKRTRELIDVCEREGIDYDIEVAASSSGTTAWAIQCAEGGIPSMLVSIPLKYMHTNVELAEVSDSESVSTLLKCVVEGGLKNA